MPSPLFAASDDPCDSDKVSGLTVNCNLRSDTQAFDQNKTELIWNCQPAWMPTIFARLQLPTSEDLHLPCHALSIVRPRLFPSDGLMKFHSHHHRFARGFLSAWASLMGRATLMGVVVFSCMNTAVATKCSAAIVGFLTDSRMISGERFQSDLLLAADAGMVGDEIELINLDLFHSRINSGRLTDFGRVRFDSAPRLAAWQDGQQFGVTPGFESVIVLDAYANASALPYPITDTDPFFVGTFTFSYGGLGLGVGDTITLDLSGRDDGSASKTTSIAIRTSSSSTTALFEPDFSTSFGSETSVFQVPTAIPEPGAFAVLGLLVVGVFARRRRR